MSQINLSNLYGNPMNSLSAAQLQAALADEKEALAELAMRRVQSLSNPNISSDELRRQKNEIAARKEAVEDLIERIQAIDAARHGTVATSWRATGRSHVADAVALVPKVIASWKLFFEKLEEASKQAEDLKALTSVLLESVEQALAADAKEGCVMGFTLTKFEAGRDIVELVRGRNSALMSRTAIELRALVQALPNGQALAQDHILFNDYGWAAKPEVVQRTMDNLVGRLERLCLEPPKLEPLT